MRYGRKRIQSPEIASVGRQQSKLQGYVSSTSGVIPQGSWSLVYVDSEETVGKNVRAVNTFDGNPATLWHTQYRGAQPPPPHEIQIDLGAIYNLTGFRYLPRQDGATNGRIGLYAFYVSLDGVDWGKPVVAGSFADNYLEKEATFARTPARYIRLVALNATDRGPFTAVAELNMIGTLFTGNLPPNRVIDTPAENVTLTAGGTVSFTGTGSDGDGNIPLSYQWDFGDPAIADSAVADPGAVQFITPGTYTVRLTVTDAQGVADPAPATRVIKVQDSTGDTRLSQVDWRLKYVDSEETVSEDGQGVNAFDGNPGTFWHTEWKRSKPAHPHEIQIDLGAAYTLDTLHYLPRQDGNSNGRIKDYALYVSGNGADWGAPVALGSFTNTSTEQSVVFPPKTGRFIRLIALNEVNGKPFTSAAEINLEGECQSPYLKLAQPLSQWVQESPALKVIASVCLTDPAWGVKFVLDGGGAAPGGAEAVVAAPPYEHTFQGLDLAEHTVEAFIVDNLGRQVTGADTHDKVIQVGIGDHYVALGDSITTGAGDDIASDNRSQDGRNFETGYTPILNDFLTHAKGYPHTVVMAGVPNCISARGLQRLPDVIKRNPQGKYYLILYGTNDSGRLPPTPTGLGLHPGDSGYSGSYKDSMQQIITMLTTAGKQPYLAKVPYTLKEAKRNELITKYNRVIDELVTENGITITPPDFFTYFKAHQEEFSDKTHPSSMGYQAMARLWFQALQQVQDSV